MRTPVLMLALTALVACGGSSSDAKDPSSKSSGGDSKGSTPKAGVAQAVAGIRSCLALLEPSKAKGCIRDQIKIAKRSCRKLHSKKSRATCVRAVNKFAKKAGV